MRCGRKRDDQGGDGIWGRNAKKCRIGMQSGFRKAWRHATGKVGALVAVETSNEDSMKSQGMSLARRDRLCFRRKRRRWA